VIRLIKEVDTRVSDAIEIFFSIVLYCGVCGGDIGCAQYETPYHQYHKKTLAPQWLGNRKHNPIWFLCSSITIYKQHRTMRRTVGAIVLLAILVLHLALVQADDPKPKKPNSAPGSSKPKSLGLRCVFVSLAVCSVSRSVFISLSLTRTLSLSLSLYRARSFFLFPPCFLSFAHIHLLSFSPTVLFSFSFWLSLSYTRTCSV